MDRLKISAALNEIGLLLKVKGKDYFRSRAYLTAAQALANIDEDFDALVKEGRLTEIKGIGKSLANVIAELYLTDQSQILDKLRKEFPPGALALLQIPGITRKQAEKLHNAGIMNAEQLRNAIESEYLSNLPGFSGRTVKAIRKRLSSYENSGGRLLLVKALKIANGIVKYVRRSPDVINIEIAGSARRWKETVSTIRITASTNEPANLIEHFLKLPSIAEIKSKAQKSIQVRLIEGAAVSFSVSRPEDYPRLLHAETGSESHLKQLEQIRAKTKSNSKPKKIASEADIYTELGMQYVPPELREGEDEIKQALKHSIPNDLITIDDIKGMVHCHSNYSDGSNTIEEMARAAQSMGMQYMTVTDHSPTAFYAGGVKLDRLKKQWDEIDRLQETLSIKLLRGTESDILRDGELDYPDRILDKFDVIIASIHSRYKLDEDQMTKRIITAMRNPHFKIWGHPLGRLVQRRPPIACRMEEILDVVAESRAVLEISADPHRLDLEPGWIKEARKRSIKFVISTDAHSISDLNNLKFGIGSARRGAVRRTEVLNTLTVERFQNALAGY